MVELRAVSRSRSESILILSHVIAGHHRIARRQRNLLRQDNTISFRGIGFAKRRHITSSVPQGPETALFEMTCSALRQPGGSCVAVPCALAYPRTNPAGSVPLSATHPPLLSAAYLPGRMGCCWTTQQVNSKGAHDRSCSMQCVVFSDIRWLCPAHTGAGSSHPRLTRSRLTPTGIRCHLGLTLHKSMDLTDAVKITCRKRNMTIWGASPSKPPTVPGLSMANMPAYG